MKKNAVYLLLLFTIISQCFGQTTKIPISFFSAVSSSTDISMIKLTQDLFYAQLSAIDSYAVKDNRTEQFDIANMPNDSDFIFYVEIQQKNDLWICTLNAINTKTKYISTSSKEYESYYMILLDAKNTLASVMGKAVNPNTTESTETHITSTESNQNLANEQGETTDTNKNPTIELLSGTWKGDPEIDKIVILRGGRGFAIFRNGATMNINISITGQSIVLTQVSKNNASYFPDLPREIALSYATDVPPISWTLTLSASNSLSGEKTTLKPVFEDNKIVAAEQVTMQIKMDKQTN